MRSELWTGVIKCVSEKDDSGIAWKKNLEGRDGGETGTSEAAAQSRERLWYLQNIQEK